MEGGANVLRLDDEGLGFGKGGGVNGGLEDSFAVQVRWGALAVTCMKLQSKMRTLDWVLHVGPSLKFLHALPTCFTLRHVSCVVGR
jgi:hypothetical protein